MKRRITLVEFERAARAAGMGIQHDCAGFRLVRSSPGGGWEYVYPNGGICPTATKRECMVFLEGYQKGKRDWQVVLSPISAESSRRKFVRLGAID